MAIAFGRIRYISRSTGGNACRSSAYNARTKLMDERTGEVFDFSNRDGLVYHEVLLPPHVDKKFQNISILSNEVEKFEKQCNSQLYSEFMLPLDKNLDKNDPETLEIYKDQIYEYIKRKGWVREGLGVQIDIHRPHNGDINWHCHGLVTTRRFTDDGKTLNPKKARDLQPQIRNGYMQDKADHDNGCLWRDVQNDDYKLRGLPNRVDAISTVPQEHIGPVRMRSILNQAMERNELRKIAHLENMKDGGSVLDRITRRQAVFSRQDLELAVKDLPDAEVRERLVQEALNSDRIIALYRQDEDDKEKESLVSKVGGGREGKEIVEETDLYTTREVRQEEERIMRLATSIKSQNNFSRRPEIALAIKQRTDLSEVQRGTVEEVLLGESGVRVLRGRAGTGKSHVLGVANQVAELAGEQVIALSPTNKAKEELSGKGFKEAHTVKGFLFGLNNGRAFLPKRSLVVLDEAGMVANADLQELLKVVRHTSSNLVLAGDERQLLSVERGGLFEVIAGRFGSYELAEIRRQSKSWSREMASCFAGGYVAEGIKLLDENGGIRVADTLEESIGDLIGEWSNSSFPIEERLIITVRNRDVDALNDGIRETLKANGTLGAKAYRIEKQEKLGEQWVSISREFMVGDRVMFAANNKQLGIGNGAFGTLLKVSKDKFVVRLDSAKNRNKNSTKKEYKDVAFNPAEIEGLRYGYAVTTYKAQGASIKDVYVLHSRASNSRSSYVNLTRHVDELKLFYNRQDTKNIRQLIQQLSRIDERSASLQFTTRPEIEHRMREESVKLEQQGIIGKVEQIGHSIGKWITGKVQAVQDRVHTNPDYYNFEEAAVSLAKVEEVLLQQYKQIQSEEIEMDAEKAIAIGLETKNANIVEQEMLARSSLSTENVAKEKAELSRVGEVAVNQAGKANSRLPQKERFYQRADRVRAGKSRLEYKEIRDYRAEFEALKHELQFSHERIVTGLLGEPNKALSNSSIYRYGKKGSLAVTMRGSRSGTWYDFEAGEGGDMIALLQRETGQDFKEATEALKNMLGISRQATLKLVRDDRATKQYAAAVLEDNKELERNAREAKRVARLYEKSKEITEHNIASRYLKDERKITAALTKDIRTTGICDRSTQKHYPSLVAFARNTEGEVTGGQQIMLDPETAKKAAVNIAKKSFGRIKGSFVEVQGPHRHRKASEANRGDPESITFIAEGLETALSIKETGLEGKILCSLGISNIKSYPVEPGERIMLCADNDGEGAKTLETIEKAREALEEAGAIVHIVCPKEKGDFNDLLKSGGKEAVQEILTPAVASLKLELTQKDKILIGNTEEFLKAQESILAEIKSFRGDINQEHYSSLLATLAPLDHKEKLQYITDLRDRAMKRGLTSRLHQFKIEKMSVYTLKSLKPIVVKEQEYLKGIYEARSQSIEKYPQAIGQYLRSGQVAQKFPEKITEAFKEGEILIKEGFEPEIEVARLLHSATNPEVLISNVRSRKEYYWRKTAMSRLDAEIKRAKTPTEVLKAIEQRENFLASLEGNLKHSSFDVAFTTNVSNANANKEDRILSKLEEIVKAHLKEGITSEKEIVQKLQESADIKQVYHSLDKSLESHQINKRLNNFDEDLKATQISEKAIGVLEQKELYLSSLYGNLKYQDHEAGLNQAIAAAYRQIPAQLKELEEVLQHTAHQGVMTEAQLLKSLQGSGSLKSAHQNLVRACQDHHVSYVEKNLDRIAGNQVIEIGSKKFDCSAKYLEHEIANPAHKYTDLQRLNRLQQQKQLELKHQMHGPGL